jgi:hypothetical protein
MEISTMLITFLGWRTYTNEDGAARIFNPANCLFSISLPQNETQRNSCFCLNFELLKF